LPRAFLEVVGWARDRADALSDLILASDSLSDPSIDHEIRAVCQTVGSLAAAMRPADAVNVGSGGE
jgi:hypothetical protein